MRSANAAPRGCWLSDAGLASNVPDSMLTLFSGASLDDMINGRGIELATRLAGSSGTLLIIHTIS